MDALRSRLRLHSEMQKAVHWRMVAELGFLRGPGQEWRLQSRSATALALAQAAAPGLNLRSKQ